jgi:hypothetical protein
MYRFKRMIVHGWTAGKGLVALVAKQDPPSRSEKRLMNQVGAAMGGRAAPIAGTRVIRNKVSSRNGVIPNSVRDLHFRGDASLVRTGSEHGRVAEDRGCPGIRNQRRGAHVQIPRGARDDSIGIGVLAGSALGVTTPGENFAELGMMVRGCQAWASSQGADVNGPVPT